MTIETERAPGVVFTFTETEPDGGGKLRIEATTPKAKRDACWAFRSSEPEHLKFAPCCDDAPYVVEKEARDGRNYGREAWYAFPLALDNEWFEPYKKALERCTGWAGEIPDFAVADYSAICPTHCCADLRIEDGHLCATVYVHAHAWNGKTALDYGCSLAERNFKRRVGEELFNPEFIQTSGGLYKRNPSYPSAGKVVPRAKYEPIWDSLFAWWRANKASAQQRAILDACDKLRQSDVPSDYSCKYGRTPYSSSLYALDPEGGCDWDGKGTKARVYSWAEFAALAEPVTL